MEQWELVALFYGEGARCSSKPYDFQMREGAAWERLKDCGRAEAAYGRALEARPISYGPT